MKPLVSIVIPNYNYATYLRRSLDSALAQTYERIEIIVVDDCSTDYSAEIIQEYAAQHSKVFFYQNEKNMGVVASHNRCVSMSHGEYIVVLSSDDYLEPHFVERCLTVLERYPSAAMVASDLWYVDQYDHVTTPESFYPESFFCKGIYQCKIWMFTNTFVPSQVLFRRKCIEDPEIGGMFSYQADTFIDTELWFRMCLKYDFVYLKERLCYYRMHVGSYSKSYANFKAYLQFYLTRRRFGEMTKDIPLLAECADEAVRRSTRIGVRTIRNLLDAGDYQLAEQYLHITEGLDAGFARHPYYAYALGLIRQEAMSAEERKRLVEMEIAYNDSCKAPENRGKNVTAPYELPERVEVFL